jgi:hypothetical protein
MKRNDELSNANYKIQVWALGSHPEIKIDELMFGQLKQARRCLSGILAIEEKYELLLSNFLDLETECLNITCINMISSSTSYNGFFDIRLALNRRIVNLLTSTRLYIDQIQRHVKACKPDDEAIIKKVKSLLSTEYDSHFEYRFMEALRNYVQHCGLAVHSTSLGGGWTSHEDDGELEFKTRIFTHKSVVENEKGFKKAISKEMTKKVELIYATRVYIESISKIHCEIRELLAESSKQSRQLISKMIEDYKKINSGKAGALSAVCLVSNTPTDKVVEKFPLLLEWDDIRIELEKKNSRLINLRKSFVSGSAFNKVDK